MQPVAEHIDYKLLYEQQKATNEEISNFKSAALALQLEKFKKMIFGAKNERFVAADDNKNNSAAKA